MSIVQSVITMTVFLPVVFCAGALGGGEMNTVSFYDSYDIANANYIIERTAGGVWQAMDEGFASGGGALIVLALAMAPDGTIYAGGQNMTTAHGVAINNIAAWDGSSWAALAGGGLNGAVSAIVVRSDGKLLVFGDFSASTGVPAVTMHNIGLYDVVAGTWSAVGAGLNNYANDAVMDSSGNVYATGVFDDLEGGAGGTYSYIVKISGATYSALGTGLNNTGLRLAMDVDDLPLVTGYFTAANGVTANYVAKWNGTTFTPLSTGLNSTGIGVGVTPDGRVYVSGAANTFGGITASCIAMWANAGFTALGTGLDQPAYRIKPYRGNSIIAAGAFSEAGGLSAADSIAIWNGSTWSMLDVDLPGAPTPQALLVNGERIIIGYNTAGTAIGSGLPTATITNDGTVPAQPRFVIKRSGGTSALLESIINRTTGQQLLFDWSLLDGEEIVIDLAAHTITSSITGNQLSKVLPNSNLTSFALRPGVNDVGVYISSAGSPTLTAHMQWETQYANVDGAAQ